MVKTFKDKEVKMNDSLFYTFVEGEFGTKDYRMYFLNNLNDKPISPFHDIPTWVNKKFGVVFMVNEIPKGSKYKLEISTDKFLNPIKHDYCQNNEIRKVAIPYPANYGAIPQTWENPEVIDKYTKAKGDNDPIDIFDISCIESGIGSVKKVKILGIYGLIDEGETDWKVIGIDIDDPLHRKLNTFDDIEREMPGKLEEIFTFLRDYKVYDGKMPNTFAFDGKMMNKHFASDVIDMGNDEWKKLVSNKVKTNISTTYNLNKKI